MTSDENMNAMGMILQIISEANEIADKMENLMNANPASHYGFPAENVARIINALRLNAKLASNLFEENQEIRDMIQEAIKKAETPE